MNRYSFTQQGIKIGATADTKPLYTVLVKDIDESIIPVPYESTEITIRSLIKNYEEITNCKKIALVNGNQKERVYFMILGGYYLGNIAKDQFKLSSMDLPFDRLCFQVVDYADKESIQVTESKVFASQQSSMIRLKVKYNQDTFEEVINCNEKVVSLKNQLKQTLKLISVDMMQINFQNIILLNSNKLSHYKGLVDGSEIAVVLCCRTQNCLRKGTMITTVSNGQISIEQLKTGTKTISFATNEGHFVEEEISVIKRQKVSEYIQITLEDGTVIEATPNHLFLCSDRRYRKYQLEINSEPLNVGDILLQIGNKESLIKSIELKHIQPAQQFYYLFLKKGNNFIANNTIAYNGKDYNISFQIDYNKIHGDQMSFRSDQQIKNIKKALQMRYQQHHTSCMKIICSGRQCLNSASLLDYGIGKEAKLTVSIKKESDYLYFHPDTEIIFQANKKRKIRDILKQEDRKKIQFQNEKCFFLSCQPDEKKFYQFYKISLEEGQEIFISGDTFLEMENGEAKISHELFQMFNNTQNKLYLKKVGGQMIRILKISRTFKIAGQSFHKIQIQQQSHLVISPSIQVYSSVIFLTFNQYTIALGVNKKTTIMAIKQKLSALYNQHVRTLHFYYNNKELINQMTFHENQIKTGDLVQVTTSGITQSMIHQPQRSKDNQLQIQLKISESQMYKISYEKFKDKTVQQIMKYLIPSYKSSFFFLYERFIILPTENLKKIQNELSLEDSEEVSVTVIRNQKLSFVMNMNLKGSKIHNISFIVTEKQSQISLMNIQDNKVEKVESSRQYREVQQRIRMSHIPEFYKQERFYKPFLYFFDPDFREEMRQFMKNFSSHLEQQQDGQVFKMIKSLYINLIYLPNHISRLATQTFFGVRNFKFCSHFNKNDTFYLYEYLLTSNDEESVKSQLNNNHGTLFRLTSVTGKRINDFSANQQRKLVQTVQGNSQNVDYLELLFPPYTYFLVDKVKRHQCFDEVWISEISTPWTLQKDIILWVDDNPINNIRQMEKIIGRKDLQILPLTSTLQARKWLKQFGWLMTWKGINFKLISDMHRQEYNEDDDEKQSNPTAGFQLIEKIYQENDGDIKVCIYCGDKQRTETLLKNDPRFEKIRPKFQENSFKIEQREAKILEFCNEQ